MKRCIDDEMLADYLKGRLGGRERERAEEHFADCGPCLERLAMGKMLLRGESALEFEPAPEQMTQSAVAIATGTGAPRDSLLEKAGGVVRGVCSKITDFVEPIFTGGPQPAMVRGEGAGNAKYFEITKKFEGFEARIEIEKAVNKQSANIRVSLADPVLGRDARVTLKTDSREIASVLLNEGHALFEDIAFGRHRLDFTTDGAPAGTYDFEVRDTGDEKDQ